VAPIAPNPAVRAAYNRAYRRYRRLFESLKPMFGSQISAIAARRTNRSAREVGAR
jgi:hypothetical protein